MLKREIYMLLVIALLGSVLAVPAPDHSIKYAQTNGETIEIFNRGDEYIHWGETLDGYTVLPTKEGTLVYGEINNSGDLVPTTIVVNNEDKHSQEEITFRNRTEKKLEFSKNQIEKVKNSDFYMYRKNRMGGFPNTGNRKLLMVLANFSDTGTSYTQNNFNNYMNQENYNGTGSFKDYYTENSYGQLIVTTTVTTWVTVPNNHNYYGPESRWDEFVRDACVAANDAGVDFSQFDNDGDGTVDGVAVIHQGPGQEATSNANDIWSHNWSLHNYNLYLDGKRIYYYTCQPETSSGGSMASIGVMCHEFGHNLGAPDYYDTDNGAGGQQDGTGKWDMMASGSYNGYPSGSKPAHHNAYTKVYTYGWATATTLNSGLSVSMDNAAEHKEFYRINTQTSNEFFLMENRQLVGFDSRLPSHGLVIYHADGNYITAHLNSNDINTTSHQGFYPKSSGSINSGSTTFPGSGNKTEFTDTSYPNSKSWASENTAKPITAIAENGGIITFDFMGGSVDPILDAAITEVTSPSDDSNLTNSETITVTIHNNGTEDLTSANLTLKYELNNGSVVTETYSGSTITPGNSAIFSFATKADMSQKDLYKVKAYSVVAEDNYASNDTTLVYVGKVESVSKPRNLAVSETSGSINLIWEEAVLEPLSEDFESGVFPPANWTLYQLGDAAGWTEASSGANSSGHSIYHDFSLSSVSCNDWVVLPKQTLTSSAVVSFDEMNKYMSSFYEHHGLWISTGSGNPADGDFVLVREFTASSTDWTQQSISLSSILSGTTECYLAFKYTGSDATEWFIDDVEVLPTGSKKNSGKITVNDVKVQSNTKAEGFNVYRN